MHTFVTVFRRTWLATTLCVVVAVAVWWAWQDWESALGAIVPTTLLSPIIWWLLVGRKSRPGLVRGLLAGTLIGPVTQVLPETLPMIWQSFSRPGFRDGEEEAIAAVTAIFYIMIGLCSMLIGGLVGLIAVAVQRHGDSRQVTRSQ